MTGIEIFLYVVFGELFSTLIIVVIARYLIPKIYSRYANSLLNNSSQATNLFGNLLSQFESEDEGKKDE